MGGERGVERSTKCPWHLALWRAARRRWGLGGGGGGGCGGEGQGFGLTVWENIVDCSNLRSGGDGCSSLAKGNLQAEEGLAW